MPGSEPTNPQLDSLTIPVPWPQGDAISVSTARSARVVLVGTWLLVALVHQILPMEQRGHVWPLTYGFLEFLAAASLGYRAWKTQGEGRLAWSLLALSAFLEVPNLLINFLQIQQLMPGAVASLVDNLLATGTGVLVLAGVLSFPIGKSRGGRFRRRALDGLIFATSVLFLLWVMGAEGSLRSAAHGVGERALINYLNVALLGGGLVFVTSYHPDRLRGPLGWLGASALAWLVGLSGWTLAGMPLEPAFDRWIVLAGGIPLFQGLAAWSPTEAGPRSESSAFVRTMARMFPYVPVVGALVALATLLWWAPLEGLRGAIGIFLVMVTLLLLRQFLAILDLQMARRELEDRVFRRTKDLEQAQDTLLRTERMNTLALMGAGLAHDLNNLLSAMKSSAELAVLNLEEGQVPAPKDLARIASTADRAATLTRRLMGFVRREVEELAPMDLGREIKEMEATLHLLLPRTVELRLEAASAEALIVRSSRTRLEQMLVNLVANARDAMPEGGTLSIRTKYRTATDQAVLEVTDSGTGMDPDVLERIFDPFFTTKAPGKGTGLGLSSLKAMVEEAGGSLEVASEPGQGSRFSILLPRVSAEAVSPR